VPGTTDEFAKLDGHRQPRQGRTAARRHPAPPECAIASLLANGYRTSTSKPGHHQTAIQTLPTTIGLDDDTVIKLDELRRLRNCDDYEGDPISPAEVESSRTQAKALLAHVKDWLTQQRPELI
jgi:hypothetical protein